MSKGDGKKLPAGTTSFFAGLHKGLERVLLICLVALVIEGTFTLPGVAIWYGWPDHSLTEICAEFAKFRFADDSRTCEFPYPLFGPSEGKGQTTAQDKWGIQPQPQLKAIGFREFVKRKQEREARQAREAAAK